MFYSVYLVECEDGNIYTGQTKNVMNRFWQHKTGCGANYTKKHGVKNLIHVEDFETRAEAMIREKEIKTWNHESKIRLAYGTLIQPVIIR